MPPKITGICQKSSAVQNDKPNRLQLLQLFPKEKHFRAYCRRSFSERRKAVYKDIVSNVDRTCVHDRDITSAPSMSKTPEMNDDMSKEYRITDNRIQVL